MEVLHQLWVLTGDDRYLKPIPSALAWFERSKLPDGTYARFYELQTNKPLFFVKDTYVLTYDDGNMPTHYSFKTSQQSNLDLFKKQLAKGREELQIHQAGPQTAKDWTSRAKGAAAKARKAAESLDSEGRWLKGAEIDAGEFVKHLMAMTTYVEARKRSGE
jgi:hypothetical protein